MPRLCYLLKSAVLPSVFPVLPHVVLCLALLVFPLGFASGLFCGFIDFIVEPTFTVLTEMIERIVTPLIEEASSPGLDCFRHSSVNSCNGSDGKHSSVKSTGSEGACSLTTVDFKSFKDTWNQEIHHNKETWKAQAAKELQKTAEREAGEGGQEENEVEEGNESTRAADRANTGQEEMKTDVEAQEEMENRRQQEEQQPKEEEGDESLGPLLGSGPKCANKKKPDSHTGAQQCQNDPQADCPLVYYCKRPSYCVSSYQQHRSKVMEIRPIDSRGKARRLQRISLRHRK